MEPGRKGPEGMQGKAEGAQESRQQQQQLSTSVHQMEPEAQGRVAASGHRWSSSNSSRASQPVMRGWGKGAQVSSSFTSLKQGGGLYIG